MMVLLGLALASGCKDDSDSSGAKTNGEGDAASSEADSDATAPASDAGSDASADSETSTDSALDGGSTPADASSSDAQATSAPDAEVPDGSAPVFVPCTGTKDVTVTVPATNTTCVFTLAGAPSAPTYLTVKMDGQGLYQRMSDGFYYEAGKLTLDGEACSVAKDKQPHVLEVSLFCQ